MKNEHGANLFQLSNKLGISKNEFLDFSSNINPFGASEKAKKAVIENIDLVSIYPDPEYKALRKAIANYSNCNENNIILSTGATELISAFVKYVLPKKAILLSPAYSEYEKELKKINCNITEILYKKENNFIISVDEILQKTKQENPDLIIICNPNNPTGSAFTEKQISKILENFKGFVMIDETYIEFTDLEKYSSSKLVEKYNNVFVIRGTSKFFSTPGIRLGYGVCPQGETFNSLSSMSNLWNINIFAEIMGEIMFQDFDYIENCRKNIENSFTKLKFNLSKINSLKIYDSSSNFVLCEILNKDVDANSLYNFLLEKKIIIRKASSFAGLNSKFFRVCVLKEEDNLKLIESIKEFFLSKES
ncbi:MAG: histidinol-phosphate transaminase [Cetobacterium sp.]|uniref:pyridoxal phosphate-dependent aminotransferase n=1 Tax=unclassified Cetobacterium TaxID=2630983 RepID=UPI00163C73C9|nr:histidinol-phosphate transaminase [Cetobacterium sp. 2A]MBC2856913.1 aminotransferase class I/II-fold pyridoxal phosphate-dependent enzyme [Cetobacterium sp. 2A]